MTFQDGMILIESFQALTLGIVVFFVGRLLTQRVALLRNYNIPEPVSGGMLFACITLVIYLFTRLEVTFDLIARDALLIYFFTIVGLNARFADLFAGGRLLAILLVLTATLMLVQTAIGMGMAVAAGAPAPTGVLLGTASLIGGHGTSIAWGPILGERYGIAGAEEVGIAAATLGLIMASLAGGPIARFLVERNKLLPQEQQSAVFIVTNAETRHQNYDYTDVLLSLLAIHIAMLLGLSLAEVFETIDLKVPDFLPCLLMGIILSNTLPYVAPRLRWPARTPATAMISDLTLSVFLAMSLMSMQLWTIASSIGLLVTTVALQTLAAVVFSAVLVFRFMGRDYFAAVMSAGFVGFTLGSTPTAIANMGAVTKRYGPSPLAFIILPLVSAFFIDILNAALIQFVTTVI